MKFKSNDWLRIAVVLVGGVVINDWGLSWIPLHRLHLSPFWFSIVGRGISSAITFVGILFVCPNVLKRFTMGGDLKRVLIALTLVAYLTVPMLLHTNYRGATAVQVLESFVFALFIGIEEDFFARGFIYGALERYGVWFAAIVSSVLFGLSHLTNIVWGHQSAAYTLAQSVNAGAFGFLAASLMIFSGSIWVPILLHGLNDFPMQFDTGTQYVKMVTGQGDWVAVGIDLVLYISVGSLLIILDKERGPNLVMQKLSKLGLMQETTE